MSMVSVSYSSLTDATVEAKDVAQKLDKYADSVYSLVYKKLNNYGGSWTGNISSARSSANAKVSELRDEADKYRYYAGELDDLKKECQSVDNAVKSKVMSLTASFKSSHGIDNNVVINTISYFFTSLGNSTKAGRWLSEKKESFDAEADYLKECIEDWYGYNGGKDFLIGLAGILLDVAIAVAGVVALVFGTITGTWAIVAAIATIVGAVMLAFDSGINLAAEIDALGQADDDPAKAKRTRKINSFSDLLRVSDSKISHFFAKVWDGVSFVCDIINFIDGAKKLLVNGFKWVKQIDFKDLFSKSSFTNLHDIPKAIMSGGKKWVSYLKGNILKNLKNSLWTFTEASGDFSITKTAKSIKNLLKIPKDLIDGEFSLGTIGKVLLENLVLPSLSLFSFESDAQGFEVSTDGQMQIDFTENVTGDDVYSLLDKIFNIGKDGKSLFGKSHLKIPKMEVPEINISEIKVPRISGFDIISKIDISNIDIPEIKIDVSEIFDKLKSFQPQSSLVPCMPLPHAFTVLY